MDGIIQINKPKDYTSHDIVKVVKNILNEKVGHTGTLDPNATGVLPLLIGKGTKLSKYLINHDKIYKATLKLGIQTDTLDITGKVLQKQQVDINSISEDFVKQKLKEFLGKLEQIPPMYSAIKVNGKKLYEYARKGQEVEIKPREIEIYDIKLEKLDKKNSEIIFTINCSKGTYIRTICEELANKLGTIRVYERIRKNTSRKI
ncbi:MAG: tRNA pseudouridine(55) synthase TruB [Clostridia bacterium]|jgi:tRNA pseudouridine55 synthase|nr:tRNA pseudouridine(55) synthase TruB [Clostridia bacterium]